MNKVNPLNTIKVANKLKEGKSYQKALILSNYSKNTAKVGIRNKVIQEALLQITTEFKASEITPVMVLERLNYDRDLAEKKGDIATMTRVDELLGKYLAMFTDKQEFKGHIDYTPEEKEELSRIKDRLFPLSRLSIITPLENAQS